MYCDQAWYTRAINARWALIVTGVLAIYRFIILYYAQLNFHFDEAQYWLWAQNLQWGYFSKPPMIAWGIALFQQIFGEQTVALKSLSLSTYFFTTWVIYRTVLNHYDRVPAIYAALLFITMPAVSLSSFIVSTDIFLLLFWSLSLWMVADAVVNRRFSAWMWAGFFAGCGLLTKYTMLLFLPSTFLCLYLRREPLNRHLVLSVAAACSIAAMVWLPNIVWNMTHQMASFRHLYEISQVEKQRLHLYELMAFLIAQLGVFGLGSMLLFIRFCLSCVKDVFMDAKTAVWFSYFIVFFTVISLQALWSRAFANWAAPCYVAAVIWLSVELVRKNKVYLLNAALAMNLFTMGVMYHYETIYRVFSVPLTGKTDPMRMLRGWDELGEKMTPIVAAHPKRILLAENRKILSELIYYVRPHPFNAMLYNPSGQVTNHFHLTQRMNDFIGSDFLWISRNHSVEDLKKYFDTIAYVQSIDVSSYQGSSVTYHVYRLNQFQGFPVL